MMQIGRVNQLVVLGQTDRGVVLDGLELGDVLLPRKFVKGEYKAGQTLEVFLCNDSEDHLIATTERPSVMVGEFACLQVKSIERVGAFLDWGMSKDLFLPFAEQTRTLNEGDDVVVAVYLDVSERIAASMRIDRYVEKATDEYSDDEGVDLLIAGRSELGFKAIINGIHLGLLYSNEIFQPLEVGQKIQGFVKKIRPDGKVDLLLVQPGHKAAENIGQRILDHLAASDGFALIDDKTSAETIYDLFGVSKKKYKMALGGLYKKRLVTIEDGGVRLVIPGKVSGAPIAEKRLEARSKMPNFRSNDESARGVGVKKSRR